MATGEATSSSCLAGIASRGEKLKQLWRQCGTKLEYEIESSKEHWTELDSESSESLSGEALIAENRSVFERLMVEWRSPVTGQCFFHDWGDSLKVGKKIAEGGQAEIFAAELQGEDHRSCQRDEIVVKVFKSGYALKDLERLWPQGMFNQQEETYNIFDKQTRRRCDISTHFIHEYCCLIHGGTLLKNGRFAYVLGKYWGDLRKLIDLKRRKSKEYGEEYHFRSGMVLEHRMLEIARGMQKLHAYGILHRDLKASNVLVQYDGDYPENTVILNFDAYTRNSNKVFLDVADFESSVGTIGTGFWRAPEVLYALANGLHHPTTPTMEGTIWTKAGDVYGYAMTCYEMMTGYVPFEDVKITANDVIKGARPLWPVVDGMEYHLTASLKRLVISCWNPVPSLRPSFDKIVKRLDSMNAGLLPSPIIFGRW